MTRRLLCVVLAPLILTAQAHAAPGAQWYVDTANTIPNVIANRLTVDGEGQDWTAAVLLVELTQGLVHNGAPDSARPQVGFWGIPGFEILEWDTWVGTTQSGGPGINDLGPFCFGGDLGCRAFSMSGQLVSATWGGTATTEIGPTRIANISLTDDAAGTWSLQTAFAGGLVVESSGVVINGAIVPEPASVVLLGLGALSLTKRRWISMNKEMGDV